MYTIYLLTRLNDIIDIFQGRAVVSFDLFEKHILEQRNEKSSILFLIGSKSIFFSLNHQNTRIHEILTARTSLLCESLQ